MRYVTFLLIVLTMSCGGDDNCNNAFGEPFEVKTGRTYCLPDGSELSITSIIDSYCPCDADCIWQGEAVVTGERIYELDLVEPFELHEEMTDINPTFARISTVIKTESCDPDIAKVEILITK